MHVYKKVHDWHVRQDDWAFGIEERLLAGNEIGPGHSETIVYFGPGSAKTILPAYAVLSIAIVAAVCLSAGVPLVIARLSHKRAGAG